jgi:transposase-like protein
MYQETGDAGLTCRRCGISRPTLRKWWRRFQQQGEAGLCSESRARKQPPEKKVTTEHEQLILELREKRRLGPKSL